MFHLDRWTEAFFAVSGENADALFSCLKALAQPVKSVHGALSGYGVSVKLEKALRESAGAVDGAAVADPALEYAIRFICLLVRKNCFERIDLLLERIGQALDERKRILAVTLESAAALDGGSQEELARAIKEKTGAAGVKIKNLVKPELLGGYLLRIGGFYVDASLKGQLDTLAAALTQPAEIRRGGNNDEF